MAVTKNKKGDVNYKHCPECDEALKAIKIIKQKPDPFKGMVFECPKHGRFLSSGKKYVG